MLAKIKVKTGLGQKDQEGRRDNTKMNRRNGVIPGQFIFKLVLKHAKVPA